MYLTAKEAGASRLTEQNVILTNPFEHIDDITGVSGTCLQGTGAVAITQEMVATSDVNQAGIAFTYNDASGKSVTRSTMMDFNGVVPGYFQKGVIQYNKFARRYQWRKV